MPDNASPSARNNPVVLTSLLTLALAAAVLTGASLSGAASGTLQDMLRSAGFGRNDEIQAEQRRHAQTLERIELAVGRVRTEIALLNARVDEAANRDHDAVNAAPGLRSGQPTPNNRMQSNLPQTGPEFDLGALRTSFEAEAVALRARTSHPHPRRAGKVGPDVRI
jgi:hypothetical protein